MTVTQINIPEKIEISRSTLIYCVELLTLYHLETEKGPDTQQTKSTLEMIKDGIMDLCDEAKINSQKIYDNLTRPVGV